MAQKNPVMQALRVQEVSWELRKILLIENLNQFTYVRVYNMLAYIDTFFASCFLWFARFFISSIKGASASGGNVSLKSTSQS